MITYICILLKDTYFCIPAVTIYTRQWKLASTNWPWRLCILSYSNKISIGNWLLRNKARNDEACAYSAKSATKHHWLLRVKWNTYHLTSNLGSIHDSQKLTFPSPLLCIHPRSHIESPSIPPPYIHCRCLSIEFVPATRAALTRIAVVS